MEGVRWILKDYASRGAWIRGTWGRMMVRREIRAYRLLRDVPGIPRLIGQIDSLAFALEFVEGRDLSNFKPGEIPAEFFRSLLALVEAMHRAGVAQGDLHHRDVLVGPGVVPLWSISPPPSSELPPDGRIASFRPPARRIGGPC